MIGMSHDSLPDEISITGYYLWGSVVCPAAATFRICPLIITEVIQLHVLYPIVGWLCRV